MKWLVQWAVTSAVLILIVLAVRYLLQDKLSARWRYALWAVVLVRLLVPFQVTLPAKTTDALPLLATNFAPELPSALERPLSPDTATTHTQIPGKDLTQERPDGTPVYSFTAADLRVYDPKDDCLHVYQGGFSLGDMAVALWLAGAGLAGTGMVWANLHFYRKLRKRRTLLEDMDALIPVYTAEGLPSPCLFGMFRPAVYVTPGAAEAPGSLRHVLAHELTHYAHKDHIWSLLRCLALALHWYDPLVWLAAVLSKRDGELACDEGAVARLGEAERIPYGRTLVDMVAQRSRPSDLLSCSTAMTGSGKSIQQRVAQLVNKRPTVKAALFAAIAVVALSVVFVFAARDDASDLERFSAELERAASIELREPSDLDRGSISDPELMAQAKALFEKMIAAAKMEDNSYALISLSSVAPPEPLSQSELETLLSEHGYNLIMFPSPLTGATVSFYYYLAPYGDQCLLLRAQLNIEEEPVKVLGGLPGNTISKLQALSRQQQKLDEPSRTPRFLLDRFLDEVENAAAIYYNDPSPYHSDEIFEPIVDHDLLANAKARLSDLIFIGQIDTGSSGPDPKRARYAPQVTICSTLDKDDGQTYRLLLDEGYTYLLPLEDDTILARSAEPDDLSEYLKSLARHEYSRRLRGEEPQPRRFLTQEEIDRANEAFEPIIQISENELRINPISCFFTSSYDDPTQIDLEEFLRYCPVGETLENDEVEEFQAVMEKADGWFGPDRTKRYISPGDLPVPTHRRPREEVSVLLQKYAGVTAEELDWDNSIYLEEYDAFYNFTSDYGPGIFQCTGGAIIGDNISLWSDPTEGGVRSVLAIRKSGDGYLIQSFYSAYH